MKFWEVDQRPDREILLPCTCGADHYVSLAWYSFLDEYIEACISDVWKRPRGLWGRIKGLWWFFWKAEYCATSVEMNWKMLEQMRDWCNETLAIPVETAGTSGSGATFKE